MKHRKRHKIRDRIKWSSRNNSHMFLKDFNIISQNKMIDVLFMITFLLQTRLLNQHSL